MIVVARAERRKRGEGLCARLVDVDGRDDHVAAAVPWIVLAAQQQHLAARQSQRLVYDLASGTITTVGGLPADRIDWARTKDMLVYNSGSNIYTFDLTTETSNLIMQDGRWASWSPDDSQIVFSRLRKSIRWELYKYTFSTDTTTTITSGGRSKKALPGRLADWKR